MSDIIFYDLDIWYKNQYSPMYMCDVRCSDIICKILFMWWRCKMYNIIIDVW